MFNLYTNNILLSRLCLARIISRLKAITFAITYFAQDLTLTYKVIELGTKQIQACAPPLLVKDDIDNDAVEI